MARFQRPAEGTWTEHHPELGTGPVSFADSVSPAFFELEQEAIFRRGWLHVGRVEQLPRKGSYFTKQLPGLRTSVIVSRNLDAERLLQLLHSLLMVSYAVEVWKQPKVIHCGSARIDRILEPRP